MFGRVHGARDGMGCVGLKGERESWIGYVSLVRGRYKSTSAGDGFGVSHGFPMVLANSRLLRETRDLRNASSFRPSKAKKTEICPKIILQQDSGVGCFTVA